MPDDIRHSVYNLLGQLPKGSLAALEQFFLSKLNSNLINKPFSGCIWYGSASAHWAKPPTVFAAAGQDDDFHLACSCLPYERLLISPQHPIIGQILNLSPCTFFIFSHRNQSTWRIINVPYEKDSDACTQQVNKLRRAEISGRDLLAVLKRLYIRTNLQKAARHIAWMENNDLPVLKLANSYRRNMNQNSITHNYEVTE